MCRPTPWPLGTLINSRTYLDQFGLVLFSRPFKFYFPEISTYCVKICVVYKAINQVLFRDIQFCICVNFWKLSFKYFQSYFLEIPTMCQDVCCVGGAAVLSPRREISSSSDEQPLGPAVNQVFVKNVFWVFVWQFLRVIS